MHKMQRNHQHYPKHSKRCTHILRHIFSLHAPIQRSNASVYLLTQNNENNKTSKSQNNYQALISFFFLTPPPPPPPPPLFLLFFPHNNRHSSIQRKVNEHMCVCAATAGESYLILCLFLVLMSHLLSPKAKLLEHLKSKCSTLT